MWPCYKQSAYHCVGIPCLCALSASTLLDSSLHQLDFFLEIFLWRLVISTVYIALPLYTMQVSIESLLDQHLLTLVRVIVLVKPHQIKVVVGIHQNVRDSVHAIVN